jgi:hypothetical protein
VVDIQLEEIRQYLRSNPQLFENSKNFRDLCDFLSLQDQSLIPSENQFYVPISILSIPVGPIINIKQVNKLVELVKIEDQYFIFQTDTGLKRFPSKETTGGDQLQRTMLFDSLESKDQFLEILLLKFGNWTISIKDQE